MVLGAEAAIRRFGDLARASSRTAASSRRSRPATPTRARAGAAEIVQRNQKFVLGLYALAGPDETETT